MSLRTVDKIRYILNVLFLAGTVITLVLWMMDGSGSGFKIAGLSAMTFKVMEFILRFVN